MNEKDKSYINSLIGSGPPKLSDYDGDGYPDIFDCHPLDPTRDGYIGEAWARLASVSSAARRRIYRPVASSGREAVSAVYRRAYGAGAAARMAADTRIRRAKEFVRAPPAERARRIEAGKEAFIKSRKVKSVSEVSRRIHEGTARIGRATRELEGRVAPRVQDVERALGFHKAAIPKTIRAAGEQVKQLTYGIAFSGPAAAVEMAGMVPGGVETIARKPSILPAAAAVGMFEMGRGVWHGATTAPARTAGEFITMGAIAKGIGEAPKISPYYRGKAAGVKVYTGEPSWIGRLRGKKPHPTPEARMGEILDPAIYETPQKFYHGTSMEFLSSISKTGKLKVSPEAVSLRGPAGGEASLFLSKPGTPYARFATPQRTAKIGTGDAAIDVQVFQLEQMMRGKIPRSEGIKAAKPSKKLSDLISERERLTSELYGLEQSKLSPLSPKRMSTEAKLYDTMRAVEKQVVKDYKSATGEKVSVRDRPGAFLEIEQKPFRPSEKLIEKSKAREMLRDKEKAGTITKTERAKLRRIESELKKETLSEYFKTPHGEVVPGPKPMYGYEWKGIPEAEFVMRAGTELFPTSTFRSRAYARLGIEKGTHFAQDPSTGRYAEILKVTTKPPTSAPPKHLIDLPKSLDPLRQAFPRARKLSKKQKSEVVRIKRQITDAEKVGDFDKVVRLSDRVRTIEMGRPIRRIAAPVRRVPRPEIVRMTERDMSRMTERDMSRMFGREVTRKPARRVSRDVVREAPRTIDRDISREPIRDTMRDVGRVVTRRPPPTVYVPPPPTITTITAPPKKKDKKKTKKREAGPEMAIGWKQRHELLTLDDFLGYKP